MKKVLLTAILACVLAAMGGCAAAGPGASHSDAPAPTATVEPGAAHSGTPAATAEPTAALPLEDRDWSGTSLGGLWSVLERVTDSGQPLTRFDALIYSVEKTDSPFEYAMTIDRIELNDKFVDSSLNEEPFYLNEEVKKERIVVPYDVILVVWIDVPMPLGDEFIRFTQDSIGDDGVPIYLYRFCLCGDEVEFIHYIYAV